MFINIRIVAIELSEYYSSEKRDIDWDIDPEDFNAFHFSVDSMIAVLTNAYQLFHVAPKQVNSIKEEQVEVALV